MPAVPATVVALHPSGPAGAGPAVDMLGLVVGLPMHRQVVHAGDTVCRAGDPFVHLYVVHCGLFKIVHTAVDGREHVVGLGFRGDWLGLDGIAPARYACDAVALDVGEVWGLRYDTLLQACAEQPLLMTGLHAEMSRALAGVRDGLLARHTLPVAARVADFLHRWALALAQRGQRADQIQLHMTRAEIGNHLGMTLESVSRGLTRMARSRVIRFTEQGRRVIHVPDLQALADFVQLHARHDDELAALPPLRQRVGRALRA